ncbi:MAG: acyl-CoA dehydrogenase [Oligosphaeraceae bacterium]|nr:acyl-CoA dehydrogenase [Oligosphaeraceae bacterium]
MSENFFTDNSDILFHLHNLPLAEILSLREDGYRFAGQYAGAPADFAGARQQILARLQSLGQLCAGRIAPRASQVDRDGVSFSDGEVQFAPGTRENLQDLANAGLMGVTLPYEFGGLNLPVSIYTMMTEMVSRADASLQNLFGLQEIAETIYRFGSPEQQQKYLPRFANGELDGAMALTEPEAGSDLQAVQTTATFCPERGQWLLNGRKRFITNGRAAVLLVLARSEPDSNDGRGLSLFIVERCPQLSINSIEDKMGIHGSPTCELNFQDVPAELVGQRRRGLTRYVMALMNGARLAISAQAVGIAEASLRAALEYCGERQQFGRPLTALVPVQELLTRMKANIMAGRSLLYETCKYVDLRDCCEERISRGTATQEDREREKSAGRLAAVLTPLCKAFTTEMCNLVCYDSIQCHGGKGYMRDKLPERYYRDARITNIYEGTTQMQVVAAIGGVMQRLLEPLLQDIAGLEFSGRLAELAAEAGLAREQLAAAVAEVEKRQNNDFFELMSRRLVRMQTLVLISFLLLRDARQQPQRLCLVERCLGEYLPEVAYLLQVVKNGDRGALSRAAELLQL